MALTGTIIAPVYQTVLGPGTFLRIQAGGHTTISTLHDLDVNSTGSDVVAHKGFVWNGRPYIYSGTENGDNYGWWTYDANLDQMVRVGVRATTDRIIPFGETVLHIASSFQGISTNFLRSEQLVGTIAFTPYDFCLVDDAVFLTDNNQQYYWIAPFTVPPVAASPHITANITNICECDGDAYILRSLFVNPQIIYKWNGTTFLQIGAGWTASDVGNMSNLPTANTMFKYGGELYVANAINGLGTTRQVRIYQINKATGSATEVTDTVIPAGHPWRVAPASDVFTPRIASIRNDSGSGEQVFLLRAGQNVGGWQVCEFLGGATPMSVTPEDTGLQRIGPISPVYWDRDAKTAETRSVADSTPSSYLDMTIRTHDLRNGGSVDIDPRYRLSGTESPPYTVMTELTGGGSEGKTGLSSVPSGVAALANLSDDFSGASLDELLWEACNFYLDGVRDWGFWFRNTTIRAIPYSQDSGLFRPWNDITSLVAGGQGIKSKWFVNGAFQMDVTIGDITNLRNYASYRYSMTCMVKAAFNLGFGWSIEKTGAGATGRIRGFYMAANTNFVFSAYTGVVVTAGDVVRIARDGANVWTLTYDPDGLTGGPLDITPVGANISEDVLLWLAIHTTTSSASPIIATPGPGFDDVVVSGAGSIGRFDSGVDHAFHWNHIADLGANVVATPELYVDTET